MPAQKSRGPRKKIVRVSEEYDLSGIGEEMAELWTKDDRSERYSLAQLVDLFNQRVLRSAMEDAGIEIAPGEVENTYNHLMKRDSHAAKEETLLYLRHHGVDVDSVMDDFVGSGRTVAKYLRDVQNVEFTPEETTPEEKRENQRQYLRKLERRYEKIAEGVVDSLEAHGGLSGEDIDVDIECVVTDRTTGESREIKELL